MKLWFTNKHGKVVLNKKTINGLCVCLRISRLLCVVVYLIDVKVLL